MEEDLDVDVGVGVGFGGGCLVGLGHLVGFMSRCCRPQVMLYPGGGAVVASLFVDVETTGGEGVGVLGFVEDLKVVGFGGQGFHGFQGGYPPGFLVEEVGLEVLELDGTDGVGFGVGVGVAPGPSPSQLML